MTYRTLGKTNLEISPVGLGTVEIGVAGYGVGAKGLPSEDEAVRLLKSAVEAGVTYIDTARAYGVAEERIGASGIAGRDDIVVGTKVAQFLEKGEDPRGKELESRIRDEVEESLRALRVESLQLLQLHGGTAEQIERGELIDILQTLKNEGKIQHTGIATRGVEAPLAAIHSGFFETIQTAYSILDQRMADSVLPAAHEAGVGIINRSVLLKGALTPKYEALPDGLELLKDHAGQAAAIAGELGIELPELALRFVLSNDAVSVALLGTTKAERIETALETAQSDPLPEDVLDQLRTLAIDDPSQIDPAQWPPETQTV